MGGFWGQIRSYFLIFHQRQEMATLKINGLSKAFGINTVFENVTFDVKSGERIGLVGANGAGKTTFKMHHGNGRV